MDAHKNGWILPNPSVPQSPGMGDTRGHRYSSMVLVVIMLDTTILSTSNRIPTRGQ